MTQQGPRLARYEVLGRLATGGMAEVWLARTVGVAGFEKLVVLKTILPVLAQMPQFVSMFVNEARLAAMLSHPNCIQIFDLGQEGEWLYIAMEYLEGFSLSRLLKRARDKNVVIPEKVIARIIMDAASGLDYAHRLTDREGRHVGLVHRDVSPDNLLVGFSGQVKVVDFGIAKAATPAVMSVATTAGTVKGKHGYIAPEYLLGKEVDGRADVFALGVVLFRALGGKRPFTGGSEGAISLAVISEPPRSLRELAPDVNPALETVVMMALEKDPAQRFDSARAMRQAIEVAVVRAAENEEVAELMTALWPPGDEERVALNTLAAGTNEETSSPVLRSVISGTYPRVVVATPHPSSPRPGLGVPEQRTGVLAGAATPAPVVSGAALPVDVARAAPLAPADGAAPAAAQAPSGAGSASSPVGDAPTSPPSEALPRPAQPPTPSPVFSAPAASFEAPPPARSRASVIAVAAGVTALVLAGLILRGAMKPKGPAAPATASAAAAPAPPAAAAATGILKVATQPKVQVSDGETALGESPLALDLPAGEHTLRLVNRAAGVDQLHTVTVPAGGEVSLTELASGKLVLKVEPWAYVKLDGRQLGQSPIAARKAFEGVHTVVFNNPDLNVTRALQVKVTRDETRVVRVDLDE